MGGRQNEPVAANTKFRLRETSRCNRSARVTGKGIRGRGIRNLSLVSISLLALCVGFAAEAGPWQTARSGRMSVACRQGNSIVIDFDRNTVKDSVSDTPVAAQITADTIRWHNEFDSYQFDPHYGGQVVHHTADHILDRHTGRLGDGDVCDAGQN